MYIDIRLDNCLSVLSKCYIRRCNVDKAFFTMPFNTVHELPCNFQSHCLVNPCRSSHCVENAVDQLDTQIIGQSQILLFSVSSSFRNPGILFYRFLKIDIILTCLLQIFSCAGGFLNKFSPFSSLCFEVF